MPEPTIDTYTLIRNALSVRACNEEQAEKVFEAVIDAFGVVRTLELLGNVCHDKAEHISANYCAGVLSNSWKRAANELHRLSARVVFRAIG
jgi:hypothetical protein